MAFDGITIHALVNELNNTIAGGRLNKIAQPEKDELFITVKHPQGQYRLMLSVNASLPLAYLTDNNKQSPLTAPNFCMLLRKHINNGRIISITQPGLERIIDMTIEHLDDMGDVCTKHLIIELMGKHSNIIFTDDKLVIIDSIKRINGSVSSVREVLPGRDYFIPNTADKKNPLTATRDEIVNVLLTCPKPIGKAIYTCYTGISPQAAEEICHEADTDSSIPPAQLAEAQLIHTAGIFMNIIDDIKNNIYSPCIIYRGNEPVDFAVINTSMYNDMTVTQMTSVSSMLETYYSGRNNVSRIHQRSADLRQVVTIALERNYKKYDLQLHQLADTDKRDRYRIYGELLNAYGYSIPEGATSYEALNYYDNTMLTIPLDKDLTASENSKKYFARYNKLKRTYEALSQFVVETRSEIDHLESIMTSLDIAADYDDLTQIRDELVLYGFVKHKPLPGSKSRKVKSQPFHYVSTDGYDIYVGKNNIQNEELTFKYANGNDMWFHAKKMPGSHVIVRTNGDELPDRTYEEAARLAAFYSKGREQEKVEIDYVEKKQVKKVNGGAPGFVIYHTNYSMIIEPDISGIREA